MSPSFVDPRLPVAPRGISHRGVAIPLVVVFLGIVVMVTFATSYQASFVRRATDRAQFGFEAVEICESAINEAAKQVVFGDVFTSTDFPDMKEFLTHIVLDEEDELNAGWPDYTFHFRNLLSGGVPNGDKLFVSMMWPDDERPTAANGLAGFKKEFTTPTTIANAEALTGFQSITPVKMSVLSWRRDYAGVQWQDWGVLHFEVTVNFDTGRQKVTRTLHVDRMFTIYAHTISVGIDEPTEQPFLDANDVFHVFLHFLKSPSNLRTVILRG